MQRLKVLTIAIFLVLLAGRDVAHASLEQLGDAWADVVTFGAWGQSRDLHEAEIAALKKRHEEEIQRLANQSEAREATARIQEKRLRALDARYVGQNLLQVISLIDVLVAQLKDEINSRYQINSNLRHFSDWFDSFTTGTNNNLEVLVRLLNRTSGLDPESLQAVLNAAKISDIQRKKQVDEARKYISDSMKGAKWNTVERSLKTVVEIRLRLSSLLEHERGILRTTVIEMSAEDLRRRALCDPNPVAITCDKEGKNCRYYQAAGPGPCGDVVFINVFPVSFVKEVFDDLSSYRPNAEFYVDLARIGTVGTVTLSDFRSPQEVFAKSLRDSPLIPPDFRAPRQCYDFSGLRRRLNEAIDYSQEFSKVDGIKEAVKDRILWLKANRAFIDFSLDGLALSIKTGQRAKCGELSSTTKERLDNLAAAVEAVERFGDALTFNQTEDVERKDFLVSVERIVNEL